MHVYTRAHLAYMNKTFHTRKHELHTFSQTTSPEWMLHFEIQLRTTLFNANRTSFYVLKREITVVSNCSLSEELLRHVKGLTFDNQKAKMFCFVPTCVLCSKDKISLPGNSKAMCWCACLQWSAGTYNQRLTTTQWESLPHHKSMGKIIANILVID